jgi:hypothetical protein
MALSKPLRTACAPATLRRARSAGWAHPLPARARGSPGRCVDHRRAPTLRMHNDAGGVERITTAARPGLGADQVERRRSTQRTEAEQPTQHTANNHGLRILDPAAIGVKRFLTHGGQLPEAPFRLWTSLSTCHIRSSFRAPGLAQRLVRNAYDPRRTLAASRPGPALSTAFLQVSQDRGRAPAIVNLAKPLDTVGQSASRSFAGCVAQRTARSTDKRADCALRTRDNYTTETTKCSRKAH